MKESNPWLLAGGWLSLTAAILHLGCIMFGPSWYRFFGAPEPLIRGVESGDPTLHWMTAGIAAILTLWSAYAFAGAGKISGLPLMRLALVVISVIYLARGLLIIPVVAELSYEEAPFDYWSSVIVLLYGLLYAVGTWKAWAFLSRKRSV